MAKPITDMPIVVLAAGQSSRMHGADKLLEIVDREPLVRRQANMARAVTSGDVLIALPPAPHPRHEVLRGLDVTIVEVENPAEGMNASIRQSFAVIDDQAKTAMLLLCDLPDLQVEDLKSVVEAVDLKEDIQIWRGATEDGRGGHPIVFSRQIFPEIAQLRGDEGARSVVTKAKGKVRLVPLPGNRARGDLDTPEEWTAWRERNSKT